MHSFIKQILIHLVPVRSGIIIINGSVLLGGAQLTFSSIWMVKHMSETHEFISAFI